MDLKSEISFHIPIKEITLQPGIAQAAINAPSLPGKRGLLVCDENTKDFVKSPYESLTLPKTYKPWLKTAGEIAAINADFYIALGSGSLNDLVKYASFKAGKPYIVIGTAPSMNGYASANASLVDSDGFKKSYSAHAPQGIYLDTEILKNAPTRLINSGIGDSICRSTCEADATLSHHLLGTESYSEFFQLMRKNEDRIFDDVESLCKTLIFSGVAMLMAGSSAPASQSEHMLAHYMELMQPDMPESFHGEQIAVTTITAAKLQEKLLGKKFEAQIDEEKIRRHFGEEFGEYCITQTKAKYSKLKPGAAYDSAAVEKNLLKADKIETKLKAISAPTKPSDIGWDSGVYDNAQSYAKYTRDRFTFLDLA